MIRHADARLMLYEYLQNELSLAVRSEIETHLAGCKECSSELHLLREATALLPRPAVRPSEERPQEYWNQFAATIEHKLEKETAAKRSLPGSLVEWLDDLILFHPKFTYALGGALALLLVALSFWTLLPIEHRDLSTVFNGSSKPLQHVSNPAVSESASDFAIPNERVSQYFRRSKTLLVGLANLRTDQNEPLDFTTERRVSRDLIRESRYLKQQPIDPRSRELMNNLEKILIELGNIEEHNDLPNVEIIRGGIHQENLLFKIRMAEAMYDTTRFMTARDNR